MKKTTVYISGPITGIKNYRRLFRRAEKILTRLGFLVFNPAHWPVGLTREKYMHIDYAMIDVCDIVIMMNGWEKSIDWNDEYSYAIKNGKPIYEIEYAVINYKEIQNDK